MISVCCVVIMLFPVFLLELPETQAARKKIIKSMYKNSFLILNTSYFNVAYRLSHDSDYLLYLTGNIYNDLLPSLQDKQFQ